MAVVIQSRVTHDFIGLSADAKPADATVVPGALFFEKDTGNTYKYDGALWVFFAGAFQVSSLGESKVYSPALEARLGELLLTLVNEVRALRSDLMQVLPIVPLSPEFKE